MTRKSSAVFKCFALPVLASLIVSCQLSQPDKPWHKPSRAGDTKELKRLIANGLDPNVTDVNGSTPIYYALFFSRWETADYLLSVGARLDLKNQNSDTIIQAVRKSNSTKELDSWLAKHSIRER
jgi:ankyrin repeat protein